MELIKRTEILEFQQYVRRETTGKIIERQIDIFEICKIEPELRLHRPIKLCALQPDFLQGNAVKEFVWQSSSHIRVSESQSFQLHSFADHCWDCPGNVLVFIHVQLLDCREREDFWWDFTAQGILSQRKNLCEGWCVREGEKCERTDSYLCI